MDGVESGDDIMLFGKEESCINCYTSASSNFVMKSYEVLWWERLYLYSKVPH